MQHSLSRALRLGALALLVQVLAVGAYAGDNAGNAGGSTKVNGGDGFGCASGTTYQMINGIARCTQPNATSTPSASCAAAALTQGACTFSFPLTTSGSTPSLSTNTAGYSGVAQATCTNGTWGAVAATCGPNPCVATTRTFGVCSFDLPAVSSGAAPSVATTTPGYNGTGQATCTAGDWGSLSATCAPSGCGGTSSTYGSCSFTIPSLSSGQATIVSTTTPSYSGSETASCVNGSLAFSGQSCSFVPPSVPCAAGNLAWGAGCSAAVGSTSSGTSATITNSAASFTGSATFSCSNGTWAAGATSCNPVPLSPCAAGTVSWSGGACNASITATSSGGSATVGNSAAGYTGSATFGCTNGAWSAPTSVSCAANCSSGTMNWGVGCNSPITGVASGNSRTLTNAAAGYTGGATFACSNGAWGSPTGATCSSTGALLAACPANIWVTTKNQKLPLTVPTPADTLPNGHAYCLYSATIGDRYAGVFDRVAGQAVDFFPIFKEVADWTGDTNNSTMVFQKYEPRYSSNLHIQGAYCANNVSDPNQKGFYPGTCASGGHGGFAPMCFVEMSPSSSLGSFMLSNGYGLRLADGGSVSWNAYVWAPQYVDDGTNTWSEGGLWSQAFGFYQGGGANRCIVSNPQNELPVPASDNPPPPNN